MKKSTMLKKLSMFMVIVLMITLVMAGCKKEDTKDNPAVTEDSSVPADSDEGEDANEPEEPDTQANQPGGEVTFTDGIFEYILSYDGNQYLSILNFYENGVYYYSKTNGLQYSAGYYTVEEGPCDIRSTGPVSGADYDEMITCDYKITFYDADGTTLLGEAGYSKGGDMIGVPMQGDHDFAHIPDSDHTPEDENGVTMAEFYAEDDEYSMVAFKHNGTFQDTIDMMISGSWAREGDVYTMMNSETGAAYTLTDNGDGSAAYVNEDGMEKTLYAPTEAEMLMTFRGSLSDAAYGKMEGEISCYEDGTASLKITYAGSENIIEGTWVMAQDYSNTTFDLGGNEYTAPMDFATQTFTLEYPCEDGVSEVTLVMVSGE